MKTTCYQTVVSLTHDPPFCYDTLSIFFLRSIKLPIQFFSSTLSFSFSFHTKAKQSKNWTIKRLIWVNRLILNLPKAMELPAGPLTRRKVLESVWQEPKWLAVLFYLPIIHSACLTLLFKSAADLDNSNLL